LKWKDVSHKAFPAENEEQRPPLRLLAVNQTNVAHAGHQVENHVPNAAGR
jgi:hypothetical protein